jgi:protein-tyrosine phosphatase
MNDRNNTRRQLHLDGAYNIRDLGGYATLDGRETRWRTFLRADSLHNLTPKAQATLVDFGVQSIIDLRPSREIQESPNPFFGSSEVDYYHQNLIGDVLPYEKMEKGEPLERIVQVYTSILDTRHSQIRETLATIASSDSRPILFHCGAGKDRTGLIAALLLGIAGVPDATIAEDYALTARFMVKAHIEDNPKLTASTFTWKDYQNASCPPEAMIATLAHLRKRYSGVEEYATTIGLNSGLINGLRDAILA